MHAAERTRWPIAGAFAWQGALYGTLAVALLDLQHALSVGPGVIGALIAAGFAAGAAASLVGGRWVEVAGIVGATRRAMICASVGAALVGIAPAPVLLCLSIVVVLAATGALNAAINASAAIITAGARGSFLRFHAWFSAGAFAGAVGTGVLATSNASWRLAWCGLAGTGLLLASALPLARDLARHDIDSGGRRRDVRADSVAEVLRSADIRRTAILLFGAVIAAAAVDTWGVRYLRVERMASAVGGASAYAIGQLLAAAARAQLSMPGTSRRLLNGPLMASLVAGGLLLEVVASPAWVSAAGLGIAAVAAAVLVPLLLLDGGTGARPAAGVAAVIAVGELGFVIGPALIGAITASQGSAAGLVVAAAAALMTAAGAARPHNVDGAARLSDCEHDMRTDRVNDDM